MASTTTTVSNTSLQQTSGIAEEHEDLEDYETQLFGFMPKSFVSGSMF
jgi:hypothetical protein